MPLFSTLSTLEECIGKKSFFPAFPPLIHLALDREWCGTPELVKSLDRKGLVHKHCRNGKKRVLLPDMKVWCRTRRCVVSWWDCHRAWFRCRETTNIGLRGPTWPGRNSVAAVTGHWQTHSLTQYCLLDTNRNATKFNPAGRWIS